MHSLFERISYLLFDLCHFVAALDGERISVGFHIVDDSARSVAASIHELFTRFTSGSSQYGADLSPFCA